MSKSVAVIGAGKVGIVIAQLAMKAGYRVLIAGSGDPKKIELTISTLIPGAIAKTSSDAARSADIVVLAIPLSKYKAIPKDILVGKLVIDAMNYWWEVDGDQPELTDLRTSSSEVVQQFFEKAYVVKAFSHIGYHDLYDETKPSGSANRKAIAVAGNRSRDVRQVSAFVDALGFDPVVIGALSEGVKLQPGSPVFGAHIGASELRDIIMDFDSSKLGKQISQARTHK